MKRPHLPALVGVAEDLQVVVGTVSRALQQQPHAVVQDLLCSGRTRSVRSRRRKEASRISLNFFRLIKIQVRPRRRLKGCNPPDCDDDSR